MRPRASTFLLAALLPYAAQAQTPSEIETLLERCAALGDASARLACYDALAKKAPLASTPPPAHAAPGSQPAAAVIGSAVAAARAEAAPTAMEAVKEAEPEKELSRMVQRWELDQPSKRGVFSFRPHHDTYLLLANYSNSTNDSPFRDTTPAGLKSQRVELSYQLSFKMKMMEEIANTPFDLWFAYTQRSFWQAYNRSASSPFRETNYQPELIFSSPLLVGVGEARLRYVNFGLVHQSNGQTSTLSRSWNRVYGEIGGEFGHFNATLRMWKRLDNAKSDNDNIDINQFMGHSELRVAYRNAGHEYSLMARRNLNTDHGALQLGWSFPLRDNLKGYVQGFSGYGQSLIDYNYAQMSIGAGVLVDF
ncbi:phospholipase A [Pseudoduganella namucuonensis]|uniref:Phospholipase A1 n=1 Tax=Pseudoduganella namucuonensis TaxID=1035707 RepID=A0A1I7LTM3_9BURK|nr:phospholipase A [Pseudoduganella namucuonensis]SFV12998.1 phospholipase A1 [Pseudoduganella namucuonensis]